MINFSEVIVVGHIIATDGIAAVPRDRILAIATASVERGASPVVAQVVLDSNQPDVVRARAYGRLATALLTTDRVQTLAA